MESHVCDRGLGDTLEVIDPFADGLLNQFFTQILLRRGPHEVCGTIQNDQDAIVCAQAVDLAMVHKDDVAKVGGPDS